MKKIRKFHHENNVKKIKLIEDKIFLSNKLHINIIKKAKKLKEYEEILGKEENNLKSHYIKNWIILVIVIILIIISSTVIIRVGLSSEELKSVTKNNKQDINWVYVGGVLAAVVLCAPFLQLFLRERKIESFKIKKLKNTWNEDKNFNFDLCNKEKNVQEGEKCLKLISNMNTRYENYPLDQMSLREENKVEENLTYFGYFGYFLLNTYNNDCTDQGVKLGKLGREIIDKQKIAVHNLIGLNSIYYEEIKNLEMKINCEIKESGCQQIDASENII